MALLRTTIEPSLECISRDQLDAITADGPTFATAAWFHLMQRLDLADLTGGDVELKFAVVTADGVPVAVCPILRARGSKLVVSYSFRRLYFNQWVEEIQKMASAAPKKWQQAANLISGYGNLLDFLRCSLDDFLLVTNPLSFRTCVPATRGAPVSPAEIYRQLLTSLKRYARQLGRPLRFLWVQRSDDGLAEALRQADFQQAFAFYDNYLCLDGMTSLDDYLQTLKPKTRWTVRKEMRTITASGVEFRVVRDFSRHAEDFSRLYRQTYLRHLSSIFHHPPAFWSAISECLGAQAEALLAFHNERLVGFSLLLRNDRQREMWLYRIGREYDDLEESPWYFWLALYGPVQRAIETGCRTMWLGPGEYKGKVRRGAMQETLDSWYWFPRQRDRWLLSPFVRRFGDVVRQEIALTANHPLRIQNGTRTGGASTVE